MDPFFFKNYEKANVIMNSDFQRAMLTEWFFTEIETEDGENPWFQEYGATYLTIVNRSRFSCDFTLLEYKPGRNSFHHC